MTDTLTRTRTAADRRHRPRGGGRTRSDPAGPPTTIAGVLDVHRGRTLLRVDGYLPSPRDVSVPPALLRQHDLRRGDLVTGAATGDRPAQLVRVDAVGGTPVGSIGRRPEFYELTPLFPAERLRLETDAAQLTTRVIDLVAPIGKGQRALVVSPPKAGKTTVLHAIAQALGVNHPECHLMAVLVDERPEEVTQMRRSVDAEIVASTFDRDPADHVAVAELAVARAQRLVESGRDVVVLIDSITRLGRAYNLAAPGNGRTLSGGIDSTALQGPKRLLGAARNVEHGGSLTIIATALVETGSAGDTLIFEEFKSTGNSELRLQRAMADRRVFPAVDVDSSGTRREELLFTPDELALVRRLRRGLRGADATRAGEQLVDGLRRTASNAEFLLRLR